MNDPALGNACAGFDAAVIDELRAIAALHDEANGLLLRLLGWAGSRVDSALDRLPDGWRGRIDAAAGLALDHGYRIAFSTQPGGDSRAVDRALAWAAGERWHKAATAVTGALGGAGGLATTLIDLPVTTTLILRSIQQIAAGYGEDPADPAVRAQCVAVLGLGGPTPDDDAGDAGFVAARLALSGKAITEVLKDVLPRFGIVVGQKALAQATPLLGALAGATINPVFTGYYQTMAHVHFRLRRLEAAHPPDQVRACFDRMLAVGRG
ncbi:EcsC family protein [Sphingomonas sp.]|uniref:EcsC family protein n=1 Tax=Sphingomonas sp. TaxID=28214 RepID=UPI002DD660A7|nr:EcsC family protein [Sphingomonas sp.]